MSPFVPEALCFRVVRPSVRACASVRRILRPACTATVTAIRNSFVICAAMLHI